MSTESKHKLFGRQRKSPRIPAACNMRLCALLSVAPLAAAAMGPHLAQRAEPAPLLMPGDTSAITAGKYIVKFRDDIPDAQFKSLMESVKEEADQVYTNVLFGFSAALDAASLERWRNHPDVGYPHPRILRCKSIGPSPADRDAG